MARINLLPWRAERRKQREREFYMMLLATAVVAVFLFLCASWWMGQRIDNQGQRNTYLEKQIKQLDEQIETIKNLERVRSQLLARKEIIEDLQSNRSQMVHLFDQMSKTVPEGLRLTSLKQAGDKLTLEGVAESSTRVATYMRSLEASPQLGRADLAKIESREGEAGVDPKMPYVFSLAVTTKKNAEAEQEGATDGDTPDAAATDEADAAKPVDLGAQLESAATQLTAKPDPADKAAAEAKPASTP
ncbi:PilN domain-containing protein, partial [Dokdonella sp.]|uniref:PilN domain-containing protein n=1 Tax=Dokdonella sp. TaxID=2291710 RepID=UPI003C424DEA